MKALRDYKASRTASKEPAWIGMLNYRPAVSRGSDRTQPFSRNASWIRG